MSTNVDEAVVIGFSQSMGNFNLTVEFWYQDVTVGTAPVPMVKTGVHSDADWRAAITSAINDFCDSEDVTRPESVWVAFDGEIVPVSRITGLATVATSGDYNDLMNKPMGGTPVISNATRSIVTGTGATGFQVSATRNAMVNYSATIVSTSTIGSSQSGTIVLEMASTNSATPSDWIEMGRITNGQTITLALTLSSVQTIANQIGCTIPAGYYIKLRSINNSGTPTYTYNSGQETLL